MAMPLDRHMVVDTPSCSTLGGGSQAEGTKGQQPCLEVNGHALGHIVVDALAFRSVVKDGVDERVVLLSLHYGISEGGIQQE